MSLFGRRLMKWREPKIKGMVTLRDILIALGLILIVAIPFGFLGGTGKFDISIYFLALGVLSVAVISIAMQPLLPGTLVQLREDMIVRGMRGTTSERSPYRNIDCIYYTRNCAYSMFHNLVVIEPHQETATKSRFTNFRVVNKATGFYSVTRFAVPDSVNLDQVLNILRGKGVTVIEASLEGVPAPVTSQ